MLILKGQYIRVCSPDNIFHRTLDFLRIFRAGYVFVTSLLHFVLLNMAFFCGIRELSGDQSSWCQLRKCQNKENKEWIKQTGAHVAERALCCLISLMSNARCVAFHQSCSFTARLIRSSEAYVIWSCIDLFVTSCLFLLTAVLSPANCWPLYLQAGLYIWQLGLGLVGWEVSLCGNKYKSTYYLL